MFNGFGSFLIFFFKVLNVWQRLLLAKIIKNCHKSFPQVTNGVSPISVSVQFCSFVFRNFSGRHGWGPGAAAGSGAPVAPAEKIENEGSWRPNVWAPGRPGARAS